MAIDISARITSNFPRTEVELRSDSNVDYPSLKLQAIARAKEAAYGGATPPSEDDMPDIVGSWIADRATVYLIPAARERYALDYARNKSRPGGESEGRYDLLELLDGLKEELTAECADRWPLVVDTIGDTAGPEDTPKVSNAGPMVRSRTRALYRGLPA